MNNPLTDAEVDSLLKSSILAEQMAGLAELEWRASIFDNCMESAAHTEEEFAQYQEESRRLHDVFYYALSIRGITLEEYNVWWRTHHPIGELPKFEPVKIPF
jgi:hypothetical protein